jgi:hypothetical protein
VAEGFAKGRERFRGHFEAMPSTPEKS